VGHQNDILAAKTNALWDKEALDALRVSLGQSGEAAVESFRKAATCAIYNDTIETVLEGGEQLAAELDGDLQRQVEEIAADLKRRRDGAMARLAREHS
jgi:hypothetical protein